MQEQVLATELTFGAGPADAFTAEGKIGSGAGVPVKIRIAKR